MKVTNSFKKKLLLSFSFISAFFSNVAYSQEAQEVKNGIVHEAFMPPEAQISFLTPIPIEPPQPLNEQIPPQTDSQTVWVKGYWCWSTNLHDFVWCSGAWRRAPAGHSWISGYWKQTESGWVRFKGFWSKVPISNLTYIQIPPPDRLTENPSGQPGKDYFWMSGHWSYNSNQKKYTWLAGEWEQFDPNLVYVPARYVWRPEGYVFVPSYWDWSIESRGTAYACVTIPKNQSTYTPTIIVEPIQILESCLLFYPDYYYCFCHHYHFHIDWWWAWDWCPPWWAWDWWWFPCEDHWALWWWWCHPGFPAPDWLPHDVVIILFGPPQGLIQAMKAVQPPIIVTPNGVVNPSDALNALDNIPVTPQDPSDLQNDLGDTLPQGDTSTPQGPRVPLEELNDNPQLLPVIPPTTPQTVKPPKKPTFQPPPYRPSRPNYPSTPENVTPVWPSRPPSREPSSPNLPTYPSRPIYPTRPIEPTRPLPPTRPVNPPNQTQPNDNSITPPWPTKPTKPTYPNYPQYQPSTPNFPNVTPPSRQNLQPQFTPQQNYVPQYNPQQNYQPQNQLRKNPKDSQLYYPQTSRSS